MEIANTEIEIKQSPIKKGSNWRGGKTKEHGYIKVWVTSKDFFAPMIGGAKTKYGGYAYEHRLIMAKHLGRCLHRWEIVHHKHKRYPAGSVEDKQDNRIENLQLTTDDRHNQITILENRIAHLEKRVTLLEAENIRLEILLKPIGVIY